MRKNKLVGVRALAFSASVLVWGAGAFSAPPPLEIPSSGPLGPQHVRQIENRVKYWAQEIAEATDAKAVTSAGTSARSDYRLYNNPDYQYRFAESTASILGTLVTSGLKQDDKLLQLKEVNLAIALSSMPQVTITPGLEEMVSHRSPAVRYLGWEGYRGARWVILAQSQDLERKMFAVLTPAAAKEKSAPVIGAICTMADISSFESPSMRAIPPDTLREAQTRAFGILTTNWGGWCVRVMNGEPEMSKACVKAIPGIKTLSAAQAGGKDSKTKALQMVVDLMWSAARAYDQADGKGKIGTENAALLRACEGALAALGGTEKTHIAAALKKDKKVEDRGAAVRSGVWEWINDLQNFGVVEPRITPSGGEGTSRPSPAPSRP